MTETEPSTTDLQPPPRVEDGRRRPDSPHSVSLKRRFGPTAILALAAFVGLAVWLVVESRRGSSSQTRTPTSDTGSVTLSESGLTSLASALGAPVYWVGPAANTSYELTRPAGRVYVRYLTGGAEAGDPRTFLTIGTYPVRNAYEAMKRTASAGSLRTVPGGGVATIDSRKPTSVYVAYPRSNYQVEVYSPNAATARRLALAGAVRPVAAVATTQAKGPVAVSQSRLRSLAASTSHGFYWAGARADVTYELTRTTNGRTYIRYLPKGATVGTKQAYLTVATYPMANAFAAIQATADDQGAISIKLPKGGVAVYTTQHPSNIHLAYPGADAQVEVYGPAPSALAKVVARGQVVPVG